jgi:hypothetical protein
MDRNLGKYLFSRFPENTAKVKDISILDLALQLEKDRKNFNKNKPLNSLSRSVLLIDTPPGLLNCFLALVNVFLI